MIAEKIYMIHDRTEKQESTLALCGNTPMIVFNDDASPTVRLTIIINNITN